MLRMCICKLRPEHSFCKMLFETAAYCKMEIIFLLLPESYSVFLT